MLEESKENRESAALNRKIDFAEAQVLKFRRFHSTPSLFLRVPGDSADFCDRLFRVIYNARAQPFSPSFVLAPVVVVFVFSQRADD